MSETSKMTLQAALLELQTIALVGESQENEKLEGCVSFWLTADSKAKFDRIQVKTRKNFGRLLRDVLEQTINKIQIDEAS